MLINKINFFFNKGLPNWHNLLKNAKQPKKVKSPKKILIATLSGGHKVASSIESMIGVNLHLQGAKVSYLLCDQFLSGCIMKTHRNNISSSKNQILNNKLCDDCYKCGIKAYKGSELELLKLSDFFSVHHENKIKLILRKNKTIEQMINYKIAKMDIGEQVRASISRYYAVSNFYNEKDRKLIVKSFFKSALKSYFSVKNLLENKKFDAIVVNHGFYVPQGIVSNLARIKKIHFSTWTTGARKNSFIFSHNEMYYKDLVSEPIKKWKNINFKKIEKKINLYLKSKIFGSQDYVYKKNKVNTSIKGYFENKKIDLNKPLIGLTTNVIWDAQLHYDSTIFKNMMEWVFETIKFFKNNQHLNLIIRVHPTEINSDRPAREKVSNEIYKKFKKVPKNVFIVESNDPISTYFILDKCNTILTYGTKLDIEYSARGYPVIVAGEAITRNKNLVIQPKNKNEYFSLLKKLPFKKVKNYKNAKKFAYHYFFRKSISIKSLKENPHFFPPFIIRKDFLNKLPNDKNLKIITTAILNKSDFITNNEI